MLSQTSHLIIRQRVVLICCCLKRAEPKDIEVPLLRKILLQITDLSPYRDRAYEFVSDVSTRPQVQ
jgi:hypothetical protein